MIIKNFLIYGLSAGLNRAGIFLLLPFSAMYISPESFGELNIYLVSSSLLSVLLTFNLSTIISREYYYDKLGVMLYLNFHNAIMLSFVFFSLIFLPFFYSSRIFWFFLFVLSECLFLVNSNYIRFKLGSGEYFKVTSAKFIFLMISFFFCIYILEVKGEPFVTTILIVLFFSNLSFLFIGFNLSTLIKIGKIFRRIGCGKFNRSYLLFALSLIPHASAQWVNSSFDRFFVKWFFTDTELGIYSFSYSVASLLLLISSGYALGLPQVCVKNFKIVGSNYFYKIFFLFNSFILWLFLYAVSFFMPKFSHYNNSNAFNFVVLISCGLYFLFFYLYFSTSLFYERKGSLISKITLFICLYSILALYPFASYLGIVGVCIVTLSAYLIYMCSVALFSSFANIMRVLLPVAFSFFTIIFFYRWGLNV
ncbi:hypothetical protein [Vibrio rumoiensis]|uniref:hypothetical protein n=1 Tax=Vibrio rumoiensis TaxID=76258 RepID=UPI003AA823AE